MRGGGLGGPGRRAMRRRVRRKVRRRRIVIGGAVVLAASAGSKAVKVSEQDAQKIEEATGMPPEDLEDQDLQETMTELNIQSQPLTPEDEAGIAE
jgi:hypothetical protein